MDNQLDEIGAIAEKVSGKVFIVGEGYRKHSAEIDRIFCSRVVNSSDIITVESLAISTAKIASSRFRCGDFDDLMLSEPEYCYEFPRKKV